MRKIRITFALALCLVMVCAIGVSQAETPWKITGTYLEACSCTISCPCLEGKAPTLGTCRGSFNMHIYQGAYGDVVLDGLNATIMVDIPGLATEGKWVTAMYVSEGASSEQVEAIQNIVQAWIGPLIVKNLGVKSAPISFEMLGDTYKWNIPGVLELESTLLRDMPDVSPGMLGQPYMQAKAVVNKYTDYGRNWDFSGKNSFQGRLLLSPEILAKLAEQ